MKKKLFLKILYAPFWLIGKVVWLVGKGLWLLAKGIYSASKYTFTKASEYRKKNKIRKSKPQSPPSQIELKELKTIKGNFEEFLKTLYSKGKIGIILGGRGTGKSVLGMRILENVASSENPSNSSVRIFGNRKPQFSVKTKVYAMGFDESKFPEWITPINDIKEIKNDSLVLIDESGITFSSRDAMSSSNKLLSELLLITRHKNISALFIAQNSSNIEINILRQADYLLLKPHSLLQLDFERKIIKSVYEKISAQFSKFKERGTTYIHSNDFQGFISNELPSFWSEGLSKSFSSK